MKYFLAVWVSLVLSVSVSAVEFPEVTGKLHSVGELDLGKVKLTVRASCSDPKTGDCGEASAEAKIEADGSYVIPAIQLNPMGMSGKYEGYFSSGWGKRFDYFLTVTSPDGTPVIHDLTFWSWEARPRNTLAMMLTEIPLELADLTFYFASQKTNLTLKPGKEFEGQYLKVRLQKQFIPVGAKDTPDVAKAWVVFDLTKSATAKEEVPVSIAPTRMLVRGTPKKYGPVPTTRTVVHVYKRITEKKYLFLGLADETAKFEGKGMFSADVTPVVYDPKAAGDQGNGSGNGNGD